MKLLSDGCVPVWMYLDVFLPVLLGSILTFSWVS